MQDLQYKAVLRSVPDVSSKSVQQECLTGVFENIESERMFYQSVPQEC